MQQPSSDNWAQVLIEEYKQGASDVEVASALNITMDTFQKQYKEVQLFRQLTDLGRMLSSAWWVKQGRLNLQNRGFNTPLWTFNMKNRFGWAERSESVNQEIPSDQQNLDDLRTRILAKIPGIAKQLGLPMTEARQLMLGIEDDSNGPH